MKEYIYTIIVSVFVFAVFDAFVSKTKNGKIVKSIISLIITTLIAIPVINLVTNNNLNSEFLNNEDYATYLEELEDNSQKSTLKSLLLKEGVKVSDIEIVSEGGVIKNVIIVISSNDEHIDITNKVLSVVKSVVDDGVEVIVETK